MARLSWRFEPESAASHRVRHVPGPVQLGEFETQTRPRKAHPEHVKRIANARLRLGGRAPVDVVSLLRENAVQILVQIHDAMANP